MRLKILLLFLHLCIFLISSTKAINQACKSDPLKTQCPQNSFCNSRGYCQCKEGWVLNCNIPSVTLTQKEQLFQISEAPSYFTVVPSSNDTIYVYRFYLCVEDSPNIVSLNLTLFADEGTQTQFSSENFIGQIRLDTDSSCRPPLFSPYMLFDNQPNGRLEQMILQINKFKRQKILNIRMQNNQVIIIQTPQNSTIGDDPTSVKVKLSVNEIFVIKVKTLWIIIILFISVGLFSFIVGIAYCFFVVRRNRRLSHNNFYDNNLDHFEEMLPRVKILRNDDRLRHTCPVCLLDFLVGDQIRTTQCNHTFHSECLDVWCKKNLNCPVCRTSLQKKFLQLKQNKSQTSQITNGIINEDLDQSMEEDRDELAIKQKQNMRQRLIN